MRKIQVGSWTGYDEKTFERPRCINWPTQKYCTKINHKGSDCIKTCRGYSLSAKSGPRPRENRLENRWSAKVCWNWKESPIRSSEINS